MSNRSIITNHFMVRWLERAEGFDMAMIRAAMERDGLDARNDGEILWFVNAHLGFDLEGLRHELTELVAPALRLRARCVKHKGFEIRLGDGAAVTVMRKKRYAKWWRS